MIRQKVHAVLLALGALCLGVAGNAEAQTPGDSVAVSILATMARPGDQVLVPVQISGLQGREVVSGEIRVKFDRAILTGRDVIRRGSLIEDQRWLAADTIMATGEVRVVFAGATGFKTDGDLIFLSFEVDRAAALGTSTRLEVAQVSLNNGSPPARLVSAELRVVREVIDADFTARPRQGAVPLEVQFSDRSTGTVSAYLWRFGDGATSTARAPTHIYTRPDTYSVFLKITGPSGADSLTRADYIAVLPDTTPPQITNGPQAVAIGRDGATIQWTTDERSDSFVEYAPREDLSGARSARDTTQTRQHRVELSGLSANTRYYYRVRSTDAAGNPSEFKRGFFHTRAQADNRPPVFVRGPTAEEVGDRRATITWRTDEVSTSQVEYSLRENFSSPQQAADAGLAADHRLVLSGLTPRTRYYYRARSADAAGNLSEFKKGDFTTLDAPDTEAPLVLLGPVAISLTHQSATIKWVTNEPVSALINYGTGSEYGLSAAQDERHRENQLRLTGLEPSTLYHAQVISTDAAGNSTTSADFEFITRAQPDLRPPRLVVRPFALGRFADRLVVRWETDEPTAGVVEYGTSASYGSMANTDREDRVHTVVLVNLLPGTTYHFQVSATDLSGNGPVASGDLQAATLASGDTASLRLLEQPVVASRGVDRISLAWKTNRPATSVVEFGPTSSYGRREEHTALSTEHQVELSGLQAGTTYHARVSSADPADNQASSGDFSFSTRAAADTLAPIFIRGPEVVGASDSSAFIAWRTNEPASSLVEYGADLNYGASVLEETFAADHRLSLTGLEPGRSYHFRVSATDVAGNGPTLSSDLAFATLARQDRQPPVIVAGPGISDLKADRATIQWRTDEPADSFIDFGLTRGYGSRAGSAEFSRNHSLTLTDLQPGTLYHYAVSSADPAGNLSSTDPTGAAPWSQDLVFLTIRGEDRQPPIITRGPLIIAGDQGAVISFITDEPCTARLAYGTDKTLDTPAEEVVYEEVAGVEHNIRIGQLRPGTRYAFRLTCRDAAGNVLEVGTPRRAAKVVPLAGDAGLDDALVFTTEAQADTLAPVITAGPTLVSRGADIAIIEWTTDEPADSYADYGVGELTQSLGDAEYTLEHHLVLTGLEPGTVYSYQVRSSDFAGNAPVSSRVLGFITLAESDLSPPVLLGTPQVVYVGGDQVIIEWSTDEASSGQFSYGEGETLDRTIFEQSFATTHRLSLTGLSPATRYSYQISAADAARNGPTLSEVLSFTTAGIADHQAPVLSGTKVAEGSDTSAIVQWSTDEPASSFVYYGTGDSLTQSAGQSELVTAHQVVLTNLVPATSYRFKVESIDPAGNSTGMSAVSTFSTSAGPDLDAPPAPAGFRARVGLETAILSWQPSSAADLAGYTLYRQARSGDFAPVATGLADTFYVDAGLASGTPYTYYATAVDQVGNQSSASVQGGGTPSVRNVPGSASPMEAKVAGDQVTLQVANAANPTGAALTYTFQVSTSELFEDQVARTTGIVPGASTTSWIFEKALEPGQEYWWRSRASDGTFDGPWSFPSFFTGSDLDNTGDFDGNGRVEFDDFFVFADAFGHREGEVGYVSAYDLSGNQVVDFDDFFLFADVFGKVYVASRPLVQDRRLVGSLEFAVQSRLEGSDVVVEVSTSSAEAWRGVVLVFGYDPAVLQLAASEVEDIDVLEGLDAGSRLAAQVPIGPGQVALLVHRTRATPFSGVGQLAHLRFHPLAQRSEAGRTSIELLDGQVQSTAGYRYLKAPQRFQIRLVPDQFALQSNYPNPFNPETTLRYELPQLVRVQLMVFDLLGQQVRILVDEEKAPGRYQATWDGRDQYGRPVASGIYWYRLEAGPFRAVRKMAVIR